MKHFIFAGIAFFVLALVAFANPPGLYDLSFADEVLRRMNSSATIQVSGGGDALVSAVASASNGDIIEIIDSETYNGGLDIKNKKDFIIRAADGTRPIVDCGVLNLGVACLSLNASHDYAIKNLGIKGLIFKNIRFSNGLTAASGHGIASFSGKILKNVVIVENIFDNNDPLKDESFKGSAIHLNKVDGLLILKNKIINGALNSWTSRQEDGAITLHEFIIQPNYLKKVFILNNEITFDYLGSAVSANTRGIVIAHIGKPTERFQQVVIANNLIDNVQKEGIKIFGLSSDSDDDETTEIFNNVIKRTSDGIEIDGGNVLINKNIFDGQVSYGSEGKDEAIDVDGGSVKISNTITVNKTYGVTGAAVIDCLNLFNPVTPHPISESAGQIYNIDPQFISPSTNNYEIGNPNFPFGCNGESFGIDYLLW